MLVGAVLIAVVSFLENFSIASVSTCNLNLDAILLASDAPVASVVDACHLS
jgi:hypothetical protein